MTPLCSSLPADWLPAAAENYRHGHYCCCVVIPVLSCQRDKDTLRWTIRCCLCVTRHWQHLSAWTDVEYWWTGPISGMVTRHIMENLQNHQRYSFTVALHMHIQALETLWNQQTNCKVTFTNTDRWADVSLYGPVNSSPGGWGEKKRQGANTAHW